MSYSRKFSSVTDISEACIISVNDTGEACITGVNGNGKITPHRPGLFETGNACIAGVIDTGETVVKTLTACHYL
jgi:hypothetical protein